MHGIIGFSFMEMWIECGSVAVRMHCRRNALPCVSVTSDIFDVAWSHRDRSEITGQSVDRFCMCSAMVTQWERV